MIVLDTSVVSACGPLRGVLSWVDDQSAAGLAITAITVGELLYGVARMTDGARKTELAAAVRGLVHEEFSGRVLPFDAAAAEHYAEVVADRERQGRPVSVADGQIAAICRCHRAELATRNVRDFEAAGISVLDPWAAG
jgi:toxin FitB